MSQVFLTGSVCCCSPTGTKCIPSLLRGNCQHHKEPTFANCSRVSTAISESQKLSTEPQSQDCHYDLTVYNTGRCGQRNPTAAKLVAFWVQLGLQLASALRWSSHTFSLTRAAQACQGGEDLHRCESRLFKTERSQILK